MKTAADAAGKREEIRGVDEVKNQMIYRRALKLDSDDDTKWYYQHGRVN